MLLAKRIAFSALECDPGADCIASEEARGATVQLQHGVTWSAEIGIGSDGAAIEAGLAPLLGAAFSLVEASVTFRNGSMVVWDLGLRTPWEACAAQAAVTFSVRAFAKVDAVVETLGFGSCLSGTVGLALPQHAAAAPASAVELAWDASEVPSLRLRSTFSYFILCTRHGKLAR